jgi:hypothetical protein
MSSTRRNNRHDQLRFYRSDAALLLFAASTEGDKLALVLDDGQHEYSFVSALQAQHADSPSRPSLPRYFRDLRY